MTRTLPSCCLAIFVYGSTIAAAQESLTPTRNIGEPTSTRSVSEPALTRSVSEAVKPEGVSGRGQRLEAILREPAGLEFAPDKTVTVGDILDQLHKQHGVSMSRFESRPARSGQWEYYFYIDLQGHPDQQEVATAPKELRDCCAFFKVLGTYPLDVH